VIVGLNDKIIWNKPGDRTQENHFVVVTGIDTKAGVVHLNDAAAGRAATSRFPSQRSSRRGRPATTLPS
jgi:hypothetical protein